MKRRLSKDEKNKLIVIELLNKMFEIAGHPVTYEDIKDRDDSWFLDWTITAEQNQQWFRWGVKHLKKHLRYTEYGAERHMAWFTLQWGLKFEDFESATREPSWFAFSTNL